MNLAIDIGNTTMKAGWFDKDRLVKLQANIRPEELSSYILHPPPDKVIVSSVSIHTHDLQSNLPAGCPLIILDGNTPLPFQNTYNTPTTLGTDRIAAVAGAKKQFPKCNVLAIDAGTCVTYDLLTSEGNYLGGSISPGLRMRWQAMHTFTARLPLVSVESPKQSEQLPFTGKNTEECLLSGGLIGLAAEIDQIIRRYADKFADLQVVTCGGDFKYLQPWILSENIFIPELVLIGLNSIVQYEGL